MPLRPSHSDPRKKIRSFIAVDLGREVKKALRPAVEDLRRRSKQVNVRWVPEENWHLTVKFLGDVDWLATGEIGKAMQAVAKEVPAFELEVRGLHAFPPNRNPRVVAASLATGQDTLACLHGKIDKRMQAFGVDPEHRAFRAHLTLARVRGTSGAKVLWENLEPFADQSFGRAHIDEVVLFQSELRREGAEYTPLATARLGS